MPLACSWEVVHDEQGREYYANSETRESSWEKPRAAGAKASETEDDSWFLKPILDQVKVFGTETFELFTCAKARKGGSSQRGMGGIGNACYGL